jgi:hypothetical protein
MLLNVEEAEKDEGAVGGGRGVSVYPYYTK